jgi:hypothetical protein
MFKCYSLNRFCVKNKKKKTASLHKNYKRYKNFSSANTKRWTLRKTPEGGNKKGEKHSNNLWT